MQFKSKSNLIGFLEYEKELGNIKELGIGSQGICYFNHNDGKVYKIFHQFFDDISEFYISYDRKEVLRFSHIKNKTFIWPEDTISIDNEIVGYISNYADAESLYKLDPLTVNLNTFSKRIDRVYNDLKIISNNGVRTYDMMYNILYGKKGFFIIDQDEYSYSSIDSYELYNRNRENFNYEVLLFLISGYFDEFVSNYKELKNLYNEKGIDINHFIRCFRYYLSEYIGKDIIKLRDASECLNKRKIREYNYERNLND